MTKCRTGVIFIAVLMAWLTSVFAQSTWFPRTSGTTYDLHSVVWTGKKIVAVGDSGIILTSPDGIYWTPQSSGTTMHISTVVWTGTQLVAVGKYGTVLTSPDGIVWTARRRTQASDYLFSATWTGTQVVAYGDSLLTSPDGITWTPHLMGINTYMASMVWTGSQVVGVGFNHILSSSDCKVWVSHGSPDVLNYIVWTGSQLVAVGDNILTSPDGNLWSVRSTSTTNWPDYLTCVGWTGTQLVALGNTGIMRTSPDGIKWTKGGGPGAKSII